jgi:hypothetical protein
MNRFVLALAVTLVFGMVDVSRAQYAQSGCGFGTLTTEHCRGSYWMTGCCPFRDCPCGPFGQVAPSFPPAPGVSTLTLPGLMPSTLIVSPPPMPGPPPASEAQPAPTAAPPSAPTTPPPTKSADRGPSRVTGSPTSLN